MTDRVDRRLSRAMSWWLRHAPDDAAVVPDPSGWVDLDALVEVVAKRVPGITRTQVLDVVAHGSKPRFELDAGGSRIRARYGHSRPVDLGVPASTPPSVLYHGTARGSLPAVLERGLSARTRQRVHLSEHVADAVAVGARHGRPVVLAVDAARLAAAGHTFVRAAEGVWLTDAVPPHALAVVDGPGSRT